MFCHHYQKLTNNSYMHLELLTQDKYTWYPLPRNLVSKFRKIWIWKNNINLLPNLLSGEERPYCHVRGEFCGLSSQVAGNSCPTYLLPPPPTGREARLHSRIWHYCSASPADSPPPGAEEAEQFRQSSSQVTPSSPHSQPILCGICNFSAPGVKSPVCPPGVIVKLLWLVILI